MAVSFSRIIKIDRMIRQGTFRCAGEVAEKMEVSRRTIERDLEELRFRIGSEVKYNRGKGRYEYEGDPQLLSFQGHTPRELAIILTAERALRLFTGTPFDKDIHPAFNKLLDEVADDKDFIDQVRDFCNSIHFHQPVSLARDISAEFGIVLEAIMIRKRLEIAYQKPGSPQKERRRVDPFVLLNDGWGWYIVGECKKDRIVKEFALDRLYEPKIVDEHFAVPSSFKPEEYFRSGFGKIHGGKEMTVKLRITGNLKHWIQTHVAHRTQEVKDMSDGSTLLTMKCGINDYLVGWILGLGRSATVVGPTELKTRIVDEVKAMLTLNEGAKKG